MRTIDELIGEFPAFDGLTPEYLDLIAGCGTNRSFRAGELLLREGDQADRFFVIRDGSVALETFVPHRGPLMIETLHEADLLGWSWLVPPYRIELDARALGVVRTVSFDGVCLRGKCDADPALGYELMQRFAVVLAERLQATRLRLLDVYGHVAGA